MLRPGETLRSFVVVMALVLAAAACQNGEEDQGTPGTPTPTSGELPRGGTLLVGTTTEPSNLDPQKEYYEWETFRCCLLRTLVSYPGRPAEEGGNELQPDLATALPEVSADGLVWTFRLKDGLRFAPPFEDVPITANEVINALERLADPEASAGGYGFYYSVIEGFDAVAAGEATSISGLSAPDPLTLEVRLAQPTGDLAYRFAMAATAPIPDGAADGHEADYGRYLVASGPYMIEGADAIDYALPADQQQPASGFVPGQSLVLVRNPSWDSATDELRKAYVDRIEITYGEPPATISQKVELGELDVFWEGGVNVEALQRFTTTPDLQDQMHVNPVDRIQYLSLNLAAPPFDDIHVRKAANLIVDKQGLRTLAGGETVGTIATHVIPNGLLAGTLDTYDPYPTPDAMGDVNAAMEEMRQSAYDADGDGRCDDPSCENVLAVTIVDDPYPSQAAALTQAFEAIGLVLDVKSLKGGAAFSACNDPNQQVALCLSGVWAKDFPDPSTYADPLFGSVALGPEGCCNFSVIGATPGQLQGYGYAIDSVPNIDAEIAACAPLTGDERVECYAALDRMLMEEIVPWVPWLRDNAVELVSDRVLNYTFDQFANGMALDQVALAS
jgi:peptide/nickel transport system substrate-binding protein